MAAEKNLKTLNPKGSKKHRKQIQIIPSYFFKSHDFGRSHSWLVGHTDSVFQHSWFGMILFYPSILANPPPFEKSCRCPKTMRFCRNRERCFPLWLWGSNKHGKALTVLFFWGQIPPHAEGYCLSLGTAWVSLQPYGCYSPLHGGEFPPLCRCHLVTCRGNPSWAGCDTTGTPSLSFPLSIPERNIVSQCALPSPPLGIACSHTPVQ